MDYDSATLPLSPSENQPERFSPRRLLVYAGLGTATGLLIALLSRARGPREWAASALIGLSCTLVILLFEVLLHTRLESLSEWARRLARVVLYFVAGCLGYLLGRLIAVALLWGKATELLPSGEQTPIVISGLAAAIAGLLIYSFAVLRERLGRSAVRLKEAEFAEKELELARQIQERLLPEGDLSGPGWRIGARNLPARWVAGDFFDVFPAGDGTLRLAVADVAGKGIGASLIMATVKAILPQAAQGRGPAATLMEMNDRLSSARQAGRLGPREFVAMAFARYDPITGRLELSNAGMPDPYLLRSGTSPRPVELAGDRFPLGAREGTIYQEMTLALSAGDRVLFVSDGLPEAPTASGGPLGYEALARLLPPLDEAPPGRWIERLFEVVRSASRELREDDWTAVLLEHRGEN